ncbi:putative Sortilin-related receptor [Hypsibius exemplaris]|uniref:Sortilin-related receptor n=1 Tax=Hypsibius exemplaris TaxID=2072580 RepID=A0A1W0X125_HYPEX|nr:putative Sortilin-related receptor [Hypsibius exemplaris]
MKDKPSSGLLQTSPLSSKTAKPDGTVMNPAFQDAEKDALPNQVGGSTYGSYQTLANENYPTRSVSTVSPVSKGDYPAGRANPAFLNDTGVHVYPEREGHYASKSLPRPEIKTPSYNGRRSYSPTEDRELPGYYQPVNSHRKLLRGEILYVNAKDHSRTGGCGWRRGLCIALIAVILVVAIVIGSLSATGVIFNNHVDKSAALVQGMSPAAAVVQLPGNPATTPTETHQGTQGTGTQQGTQGTGTQQGTQGTGTQQGTQGTQGTRTQQGIQGTTGITGGGVDIEVHEVDPSAGQVSPSRSQPATADTNREAKSDAPLTEWRRQHAGEAENAAKVRRPGEVLSGGGPRAQAPGGAVVDQATFLNDGVPEAVEGELRIINMDFQPALTDRSSWIYQYTSNDLAVYLNQIFMKAINAPNYNATRVIAFRSGSVIMKFQSMWNQASDNWNVVVTDILNKHLDASNNFIGNYLIDRDSVSVKNIFYTCRVNNGGCSHLCEFDLLEMRHYCLCPDTTYSLLNLTTCVLASSVPLTMPVRQQSMASQQTPPPSTAAATPTLPDTTTTATAATVATVATAATVATVAVKPTVSRPGVEIVVVPVVETTSSTTTSTTTASTTEVPATHVELTTPTNATTTMAIGSHFGSLAIDSSNSHGVAVDGGSNQTSAFVHGSGSDTTTLPLLVLHVDDVGHTDPPTTTTVSHFDPWAVPVPPTIWAAANASALNGSVTTVAVTTVAVATVAVSSATIPSVTEQPPRESVHVVDVTTAVTTALPPAVPTVATVSHGGNNAEEVPNPVPVATLAPNVTGELHGVKSAATLPPAVMVMADINRVNETFFGHVPSYLANSGGGIFGLATTDDDHDHHEEDLHTTSSPVHVDTGYILAANDTHLDVISQAVPNAAAVAEPALLTLRRPSTHAPAAPSLACPGNQFFCAAESRCIVAVARCNGVSECSDGSDEVGCTSCLPNFQCRTTKKCIPVGLVCDGLEDCPDGTDELGCSQSFCQSAGMFQCVSGYCLENSSRCDGLGDCYAMNLPVDEMNCFTVPQAPLCTDAGHFMCAQSRRCIPMNWRCNGRTDCLNSEDEQGCICDPVATFTCDGGGCIDSRLHCNGVVDCPDGYSDERDCLRLQTSGLLEVQHAPDEWRAVCSDNWNQRTANSVCQQLGYRPSMTVFSLDAPMNGSDFFLMTPEVTGLQPIQRQLLPTAKLSDCARNTSRAGVTCEAFYCQTATDPASGDSSKFLSATIKINFDNDPFTFCNGYLVAPMWVVTAASCLAHRNASSMKLSFYKDAFHTYVTEIVTHPLYLPIRWLHDRDFALLRLAQTVPSNFLPLCVPTDVQPVLCKIVKFTGNSSMSASLITPVDTTVCNMQSNFAGLVSGSMECWNSARSMCDDDAVSPIICQTALGEWEVRGFLSYQHHCDYFSKKPFIIANLSYASNWMRSIIGPGLTNAIRTTEPATFVPLSRLAVVSGGSPNAVISEHATVIAGTEAPIHVIAVPVDPITATHAVAGSSDHTLHGDADSPSEFNLNMAASNVPVSILPVPISVQNGTTNGTSVIGLLPLPTDNSSTTLASTTVNGTSLASIGALAFPNDNSSKTLTSPMDVNATALNVVKVAPVKDPVVTVAPVTVTGLACPDGTPLMVEFMCDSVYQCADGWDEKLDNCRNVSCPLPNRQRCQQGRCIEATGVCDGRSQCPVITTDEVGCKDCDASTHFKCLEGRCIPFSWMCDGENDCQNGEDETADRCNFCMNGSDSFHCTYGGGCVATDKVCDGVADCPDNSDESHCVRLMWTNDTKTPDSIQGLVGIRTQGSEWRMVCHESVMGRRTKWAAGICHELGLDYSNASGPVVLGNAAAFAINADASTDASIYMARKNQTSTCANSEVLAVACGFVDRGNWNRNVSSLADLAQAYDVPHDEYRHIVLFIHVKGGLEPCVGTILSSRWIITSHECISEADSTLSPFDWIVSTDPNSVDDTSLRFVRRFVPHPSVKFSTYFSRHDLVLVELMEGVDLSTGANKAAWPARHPMNIKATCVTYGWIYSFVEIPDTRIQRKSQGHLYSWRTALMMNEQCNQASSYNGLVDGSMFCGGGFRNSTHRSPCMGRVDGAPVMCLTADNTWEVAGVRSYQPPCDSSWLAPSVYTDLYQHRRWIGEVVGAYLTSV